MENKYWEDFKVGERVITQGLTVTEAHFVNWASLSGDWYPLHMDEEYAKKTVFGRRIAHGPLVYALSSGLMVNSGLLGNAVMAFIGMDKYRVTNPVMIGDTIHCEIEVIDKQETKKADRGYASFKVEIKNQRGEVVTEYIVQFLLNRRNSSK